MQPFELARLEWGKPDLHRLGPPTEETALIIEQTGQRYGRFHRLWRTRRWHSKKRERLLKEGQVMRCPNGRAQCAACSLKVSKGRGSEARKRAMRQDEDEEYHQPAWDEKTSSPLF